MICLVLLLADHRGALGPEICPNEFSLIKSSLWHDSVLPDVVAGTVFLTRPSLSARLKAPSLPCSRLDFPEDNLRLTQFNLLK